MSRADDEKRNPLIAAVRDGRLNRDILRGAASEMLAIGDYNARRKEVDGEHDYGVKDEVACIADRMPDGRYRMYTVQEIGRGQGTITVVRDLKENLEPAMRWELILRFGRAGKWNTFEESKDYVLNKVNLYVTEMFGKAT